jgi:aryl-alcohol dehydrogenase-like predicted oxidoreductase
MIAPRALKLALGGAQFGMPYGIANANGQPSCAVIEKILGKANEHGISLVDTAQAYGNSEAVLGRVLGAGVNMRIVTKLCPIRNSRIEQADVESVREAFHTSLRLLKRGKVYGLLVHDAGDLLVSGGERLWAWMQSLKGDGKADKIGVSVYSPDQLQKILARHPGIELVQLPFSIYDQRFARSGLLDLLRAMHIEVHSRSALLQGVLLMAPDRLPDQFKAIRKHQADLHCLLRQHGLTPLAGALASCVEDARIDSVVVGCETPEQLEEIIAATASAWPRGLDDFAIADESVINPSLWANQN